MKEESEKKQSEKGQSVNSASVTNIHIVDSANVIINSSLQGKDISIKHSGKRAIWSKAILTSTGFLVLALILKAVLGERQSDTLKAGETSKDMLNSLKIKPETILLHTTQKRAPIALESIKKNRIGLQLSLNPEELKNNPGLQKNIEGQIAEILFKNGIGVESYTEQKIYGHEIKCDLNLIRYPVQVGMKDDMFSNAMSLNITIKSENTGLICFSRSFRSNQYLEDLPLMQGVAVNACLTDLEKQITAAKPALCR